MAPNILILGGSDAGTMAALRIRELDPSIRPRMVLADDYPNFSICGIPFLLSKEVARYSDLAHRTREDIEALGIDLLPNTRAVGIDTEARTCRIRHADEREENLKFDRLILGVGAQSIRPPIEGLDQEGVFTLRWMEEARAIDRFIDERKARSAILIGGGYINMELADGLTRRGLKVTVLEFLPQVLSTVDPELGILVAKELQKHGVEVLTNDKALAVTRSEGKLHVATGNGKSLTGDLVIVCTGAHPATDLAKDAGLELGAAGAIRVNAKMETSHPGIYAAGDCAETRHRLLEENTYLPLGSTSHKQGRIAGENALGGQREFHGSTGTQVVKIFDLIASRTGFHDRDARRFGFDPITFDGEYWDHKAYYPGASKIRLRLTGDRTSGRFLGAQMIGAAHTLVAKRIDAAAVALFHGASVEDLNDFDLSYSPPVNSPWDPLQAAAQDWCRMI